MEAGTPQFHRKRKCLFGRCSVTERKTQASNRRESCALFDVLVSESETRQTDSKQISSKHRHGATSVLFFVLATQRKDLTEKEENNEIYQSKPF